MKTYKSVNVANKEYMTATAKRYVLHIVNSNNPEWIGKFMQVNKITLKVERTEIENVFKTTQIETTPDWVGHTTRTYIRTVILK